MYEIRSRYIYLILAMGIALSFPYPVEAVTRTDQAVFGSSNSAHWVVGDFNRILSQACQRREFSQKRQYRYMISFVGKKGSGITGIATTDWNLHDPRKLAIKGMTYHFYNDGFSDCAVYVSPQPRN